MASEKEINKRYWDSRRDAAIVRACKEYHQEQGNEVSFNSIYGFAAGKYNTGGIFHDYRGNEHKLRMMLLEEFNIPNQ